MESLVIDSTTTDDRSFTLGDTFVYRSGEMRWGAVVYPSSLRVRIGIASPVVRNSDGNAFASPPVYEQDPQAYFWTKEWQEGEREAEEDFRQGRTRKFASADDLIEWLKS